MSDVVRDLLKNCIDERARLRAELAAERERADKERMYRHAVERAERITIEAFKREQAHVAKLRATLAQARSLIMRQCCSKTPMFFKEEHSSAMINTIDAVLAKTGGGDVDARTVWHKFGDRE